MSSLEDPRVLFAAERTLLAWQRTAVALMGFGFVIERFGLFVRIAQGLPLAGAERGISMWLGVTLLLLGAAVAVSSAVQYRRTLATLGRGEIPPGYWTHVGVWVNFILAGVGMVLAGHFVWSA